MHLLTGQASQHDRDPVDEVAFCDDVTRFGEVLGISQSSFGSRDDGQFDQGVSSLQEPAANGMPCLMVGNSLLDFRRGETLLFVSSCDPLGGILEILLLNVPLPIPDCDDGSLVAKIGDICPAEARG